LPIGGTASSYKYPQYTQQAAALARLKPLLASPPSPHPPPFLHGAYLPFPRYALGAPATLPPTAIVDHPPIASTLHLPPPYLPCSRSLPIIPHTRTSPRPSPQCGIESLPSDALPHPPKLQSMKTRPINSLPTTLAFRQVQYPPAPELRCTLGRLLRPLSPIVNAPPPSHPRRSPSRLTVLNLSPQNHLRGLQFLNLFLFRPPLYL
jgi:hypothetical protein